MQRLLLVLLLAAGQPLIAATAAEPGSNIESGLATIRQRLAIQHPRAIQPHRDSNRTPLHQRTALVRGTLNETAGVLERMLSGRGSSGEESLPADPAERSRQLTYLRQRLHTASRSLDSDLAAMESRLKGLGLPEKLTAWQVFTEHYRGRMAELDTALAGLAANAAALPQAEFQERLIALRTRFREEGGAVTAGASRLSGEQLPHKPTSERPAAPLANKPADLTSINWTAADLPVPQDLAESKVVRLTPEIRAKAAALGGDPAVLYDWVATHTEYVPYPGAMQDSQSVLWSHRGNDFDQSTLLIALLRASGTPARYVSADVVMPRADVREWVGVKDETLFLTLFGEMMDYSLFPSVDATRVTATRVWVEAYVDDPAGGKTWVSMDPARKQRKFQEGILLQRPLYDRMAYLRSLQSVLPGEPYLDAMRAELREQYPGRGFQEVGFKGTLLPPAPAAKELSYPVAKLHFRAAEIPAILLHGLRVTLTNAQNQAILLDLNLSLPESSLRQLSLTFLPATPADQLVLDAFGGLEKAPAAAVNLIPEFRFEERVIATGRIPVTAGTVVYFNGNQIRPGEGATQYVNTYRHMFLAGETAAIVLGAHFVSEDLVTSRISSFLSRLPAVTTAEATRGMLDIAALRYLHRVELDEQRLGDPLQFHFYPSDEIGYAITFASLESQNLFDRPFVVTPGRLQVHAWPTCLPYIDLNRNDHNGPVLKTAWQLHNDAISALEHEVWEEVVLIPSVSTIKILQAAIRANVAIRTITPSNAAAEIAALQLPQTIKTALAEKITKGATLTIPQRPVSIGVWTGTGWIEEFPDWDYNYIIYDSALFSPGGDTGGATPPPRPPEQEPGTTGNPGPLQNTTCSDPVNIANGNLFEQVTDYSLTTPGPAIVWQRTYSGLVLSESVLGPGWRHRYQVSLEDKGSAVMIRDGSCALLQFRQAEDGSYASPPGYNLNLTKEPGQGWLLRSRTGMESRFDVDGALQSITDRNRNSITFRYSESDPGNRRLDQIVDRAGRTVTLSYGAARNGGIRLTAIEDFSGRRVTYDYDDEGRLAAATNAAGDRTSYTYFADAVYKNLLQSISTPGGSVTSFQYYGNGKVARVTLPGGQSMNFVYLPLRKETHVIDARGLLTSYHFNALGSVVRVLRPDGSSLDRVYSADAKLESQTDAAGNTSRYTYDEAGDMTSATDALGRTLRFTYHPEFHLLTSIEDAAGNITEFEYDARGNLIRSAQPLGVEERLTWDEVGNLISVTDAEGKSATIAYDGLGGPALVRDALGNETRLEFDRLRRLTKRIDAVGGEVSFEYDALDRVVKQLDPIGRVSSIAYDGDGRPVRTTDAGGRTAEFGYDSLNHLDRVTDASGAVTSYSYAAPDCACSATSNLRAVKDAAGVVRTQTYDEQDRLVASTDPLGNTTRFAYDVQGNLSSRTDANGAVTRFEYDAVGHLTRKVFADGSESRFAYDANNNLIRASNQHVTYTFTYDALNRLETFTDGRFGKTLRYAYDRLGRRTSLVDSEGGVFVYTWDANSRMEAVRNPSGSTAVFTHDALGRRSALAYSNGTGSTYQYDSAGRIASVVHGRRSNAVAAASTEPFSQFTLAYDDAGNAVSITDPSGTHRYTYDPVNRLTGAEHPSLPAESYSYNGAGDRVEAGNSYDAAGRLTASAGGVRYAHDRNGNLIRKTGPDGLTVYTWDHSNQLVQIELANGTVAKYKYDPLGRRIEKSVGGVTTAYLYDLSSILLELDSDGAMVARYTHGPGGVDLPVMMERGGQTYFYHQDGQANVTHVTDSAGNPACSYSYDSFGRIVTTSTAAASCQGSSVANPFAFAGREYDSESGLYHMRARYYDPSLGRFLSADPLDVANLLLAGQNRRAGLALLPSASAALVRYPGLQALRNPQQLNLYSYALNNPLAHRDPSGLTCGVYVMMGAEPHETGASGEPWIQGNINNFQAWLSANHYSLTYTEGAFAAIHDSSGNVVGVANASQAGFTETPYVAPPGFWAALPGAVSEVGQILSNKFEASLQVPWHQLSGQEYWDAANNPENYVNRGGSGGR